MISHAKIPTEHTLAFVAMATVIFGESRNLNLICSYSTNRSKQKVFHLSLNLKSFNYQVGGNLEVSISKYYI